MGAAAASKLKASSLPLDRRSRLCQECPSTKPSTSVGQPKLDSSSGCRWLNGSVDVVEDVLVDVMIDAGRQLKIQHPKVHLI